SRDPDEKAPSRDGEAGLRIKSGFGLRLVPQACRRGTATQAVLVAVEQIVGRSAQTPISLDWDHSSRLWFRRVQNREFWSGGVILPPSASAEAWSYTGVPAISRQDGAERKGNQDHPGRSQQNNARMRLQGEQRKGLPDHIFLAQ